LICTYIFSNQRGIREKGYYTGISRKWVGTQITTSIQPENGPATEEPNNQREWINKLTRPLSEPKLPQRAASGSKAKAFRRKTSRDLTGRTITTPSPRKVESEPPTSSPTKANKTSLGTPEGRVYSQKQTNNNPGRQNPKQKK
jgi:hypothetical protein